MENLIIDYLRSKPETCKPTLKIEGVCGEAYFLWFINNDTMEVKLKKRGISLIIPKDKWDRLSIVNPDKICRIVNADFSWILLVDGEEINFQRANNVTYFKKHYTLLGYEVHVELERNHLN